MTYPLSLCHIERSVRRQPAASSWIAASSCHVERSAAILVSEKRIRSAESKYPENAERANADSGSSLPWNVYTVLTICVRFYNFLSSRPEPRTLRRSGGTWFFAGYKRSNAPNLDKSQEYRYAARLGKPNRRKPESVGSPHLPVMLSGAPRSYLREENLKRGVETSRGCLQNKCSVREFSRYSRMLNNFAASCGFLKTFNF